MNSKMYLLFLFLMMSLVTVANDTTVIKTSAQCNSCKKRIETRLAKVKGIVSSSLHVETKELTVIYNKTDINLREIETKISEIGYDANGLEAKKAAYKRLPACCRKDYQGAH
jgi:copper chaperone CopZ